MEYRVVSGVYPTMITPYKKNGEVDYPAVEALTEWYWKKGCDGIFADCQSSEILYLSLEERVKILHTVLQKVGELAKKDPTKPRMAVVASGHISDKFEDQVRELNAIADEKPDALILISNRMDIANTSDDAWIRDTERLVAQLPADIPLGIYECPKPYKRLLTEKMLRYCVDSGRFYFIKDTCCDAEMMKKRLKICEGSHLKIFNANAQTLLETVKSGMYGYCGVMANFHPDLYAKLLKGNIESHESSVLQDFLGLSAMIESLTYPCCAKYYLNKFENVKMESIARSADVTGLTPYQQSCIDQLAELTDAVRSVKV